MSVIERDDGEPGRPVASIPDAQHHPWTLGCCTCQEAAESEVERLRDQLAGAVAALEAADRLVGAMEDWSAHVQLHGLADDYRAARAAAGGQ